MDQITEELQKLEESGKFTPIKDEYKRFVTESLMRNQVEFLKEASSEPTSQTAGVKNWDPVLIRMVRRATPQLMAFDLAGVQPMSGPTGLIFSMRARYKNNTDPGDEALYNEADTTWSGTGTQSGDTSGFSTQTGTGMDLTDGELLGTDAAGAGTWNEMSFTIDKKTVEAKTRKLKASFSRELQHDLRNIHGLDAETELSNILSTEIAAEIDREMLRTINISAKVGAQDTNTAGTFDLDADSDGRWLVEKFKALLFQIDLEGNAVAKDTRRGKANRIICSSNVASALNMSGLLNYNPALNANLSVDEATSTYAGTLLGRYQVYIDPFATVDYVTVGYKGANAWDAGIYYCPYVPLEMARTLSEDSFQPRIGFQTRYGLSANALYADGLQSGKNGYFRKFKVDNLQAIEVSGGTTT